MTKQKLLLVLAVFAVLAIFAFVSKNVQMDTIGVLEEEIENETEKEPPNEQVQHHPFVQEMTEDEWKQHTAQLIPGFEWARELGLTRTYDEKWMAKGTDRTLQIEEIWYRKDYVAHDL